MCDVCAMEREAAGRKFCVGHGKKYAQEGERWSLPCVYDTKQYSTCVKTLRQAKKKRKFHAQRAKRVFSGPTSTSTQWLKTGWGGIPGTVDRQTRGGIFASRYRMYFGKLSFAGAAQISQHFHPRFRGAGGLTHAFTDLQASRPARHSCGTRQSIISHVVENSWRPWRFDRLVLTLIRTVWPQASRGVRQKRYPRARVCERQPPWGQLSRSNAKRLLVEESGERT